MNFRQGQTVVYPHHGPARIVAIKDRVVKGERVGYLDLVVIGSDLSVSVPRANAVEVGVRPMLKGEEFNEVFAVMQAPSSGVETLWARRIKANSEKLASGEIRGAAEVVRDLTRRDAEKPLSLAERQMLGQAKRPIASELAVALDVPVEAAEAMIEYIIGAEEPIDWAAARSRRKEFTAALAA